MEEQKQRKLSLSAIPKTNLTMAAATLVATGILDVAKGGGVAGWAVGGAAAFVALRHSHQMLDILIPGHDASAVQAATNQFLQKVAPVEEEATRDQSFGAKMQRLVGRGGQPAAAQPEEDQPDEEVEDDVSPRPASTPMNKPVRRLTVKEIVAKTEPNSFTAWIGRSMTKPGNPPLQIGFYKRHLKMIGASQAGKSSMAAAFLDIVTQTHDPQHVLVALLDLEDLTSKLFANLPHLAEIEVDGKPVLLHARSREQVLEYLGYIVEIMDYRYDFSRSQIEKEPILLVYVEEFLALKNYFKLRIDKMSGEQKAQAKKDYADLIFRISELARRGLKSRVQLILCAQVDYRDEDFQEALINVTSGMSFCVRPTAAQAAGFSNAELLRRNYEDESVGQAVAEMPDCKDLVLAPDYDLEKRLIAFEQAEMEREDAAGTQKQQNHPNFLTPANGHRKLKEQKNTVFSQPASSQQPVNAHLQNEQPIYKSEADVNEKMPIYAPVNAVVNGSASQTTATTEKPHLHLLVNETEKENELEEEGQSSITVNVNEQTRDTIKRLAGMGIKHHVIAKATRLDGRNYAIYRSVCQELGIAMEKEA